MWKPEALVITLSIIIFGCTFFTSMSNMGIVRELEQMNKKLETTEYRMDVIEEELKQPKETPKEENVIIVSINMVSEDRVSEVKEPDLFLTEDEKDMLATLVMAEAEGESELGKRLVIDTVLNRVDSLYFPETVHGVIYQSGQFTCIRNGRYARCYVKPEIKVLVEEELYSRTNDEVAFFTAHGYGKYGSHLFQEGHHYFCKDNRS